MLTFLVSACNQQISDSTRSQYREIIWEELKPEDEKLRDMEAQEASDLQSLELVNDWYAADTYSDLPGLSGGYYGAPPQSHSVGIVAQMSGQRIRIPGFIVPLEFEEGKLVTEFFLVPYFGACFHKPPPPPNQTIYVTSAEPVKYESIYDPVWVMGVIKTEQRANEVATAAYSMDFELLEPFIE